MHTAKRAPAWLAPLSPWVVVRFQRKETDLSLYVQKHCNYLCYWEASDRWEINIPKACLMGDMSNFSQQTKKGCIRTCSEKNRKPLSSRIHSYVSPRTGLKGLLPARKQLDAYADTAKAATYTQGKGKKLVIPPSQRNFHEDMNKIQLLFLSFLFISKKAKICPWFNDTQMDFGFKLWV